jgi:hypothetical protein
MSDSLDLPVFLAESTHVVHRDGRFPVNSEHTVSKPSEAST